MIHEEISYSFNKNSRWTRFTRQKKENSNRYPKYCVYKPSPQVFCNKRSYQKFDGLVCHPLLSIEFGSHNSNTVYQSHEHSSGTSRERFSLDLSTIFEFSRYDSTSKRLDRKKDGRSNLGFGWSVSSVASDRVSRGGFFLNFEARSTIYHSRSLLRSDGSSQLDAVAVAVVVGERGDGDRFILEVTGSDNPAALIATFNGIVMNGCWLLWVVLTGATVPAKQCQKKLGDRKRGRGARLFGETSRPRERNHPWRETGRLLSIWISFVLS